MRVLVVEDEPRLARMLRRALEDERHSVDTAATGPDGEAMARAGDYDAIVLDVMLPGRDGFAVCRNLRAEGNPTPVLMLTARDAVDDRVRGLDAGADDYLVKPFALAELLARLRALGRRRTGTAPATTLELGGLHMDLVRREVRRDGRLIELTPREYDLLAFFLRHPGHVLSRTQLLDGVWQYDAEVTSNVVDIYIHYLRDKIDKGFAPKLLHTVRGAGYVLRI